MSKKASPIAVHLLDKEFLVACTDEERDGLLASAEFLNGQMREIRDSGKVIGMDRIAVMAALNLAHEVLKQKTRKQDYYQSMSTRIRSLQDKIEAALNKGNQLEL